MSNKLPFSLEEIIKLSIDNPTPFYIYDEAGIIENINKVKKAFSWNEGFIQHFAVKALPNPHIIKLMADNGLGVDCASRAEILISKMVNIDKSKIIFTSNQTSIEEYKLALSEGIIINLDAFEQISNLELAGKLPDTICLRYNPGIFEFENKLIGELQDSKFGMKEEQIFAAISYLKTKNVKHFGIHAMLAGNILNEDYYPALAQLLFGLSVRIKEKLNVCIEFLDFGGGIGIPYKENEQKVDIERVGQKIKELYETIIIPNGLNIALHTELGRYISGPCGYLICQVIN